MDIGWHVISLYYTLQVKQDDDGWMQICKVLSMLPGAEQLHQDLQDELKRWAHLEACPVSVHLTFQQIPVAAGLRDIPPLSTSIISISIRKFSTEASLSISMKSHYMLTSSFIWCYSWICHNTTPPAFTSVKLNITLLTGAKGSGWAGNT